MEDDLTPRRARMFVNALFYAFLIVLCGGLGVIVYLTADAAADAAASNAPRDQQRYLSYVSLVALTLLALCLIVLLWTVARRVRRHLAHRRLPPTEYVNAWEVAGKRYQVSPDDVIDFEMEHGQLDKPEDEPEDEDEQTGEKQ